MEVHIKKIKDLGKYALYVNDVFRGFFRTIEDAASCADKADYPEVKKDD